MVCVVLVTRLKIQANNNNNSMIIGLNPMAKAFKSAEPGSSQQTGPNGYKKGHFPYFVYM
jgi:hypothetical protein